MAKLTLSFKDKRLKTYSLSGHYQTIGRSPECAILIDSLAICPQHAQIVWEADHWVIKDTPENPNGILVNGETTISHVLEAGDIVSIGKHTLTFSNDLIAENKTDDLPIIPPTSQASARNSRYEGWLQVLSGDNLGQLTHLNQALTRLGKKGQEVAMISHRSDGYYLSFLDKVGVIKLGGKPFTGENYKLQNGDMVEVGGIEMQFFISAKP